MQDNMDVRISKPSRRMHRRVTAADISNALMHGTVSTQVDSDFYIVMEAHWKCICEEEPALQSWIIREVERLVNQFAGIGVMGAYELLWKVCSGAQPALVDAIIVRGVPARRNNGANIAKLSGLMYR